MEKQKFIELGWSTPLCIENVEKKEDGFYYKNIKMQINKAQNKILYDEQKNTIFIACVNGIGKIEPEICLEEAYHCRWLFQGKEQIKETLTDLKESLFTGQYVWVPAIKIKETKKADEVWIQNRYRRDSIILKGGRSEYFGDKQTELYPSNYGYAINSWLFDKIGLDEEHCAIAYNKMRERIEEHLIELELEPATVIEQPATVIELEPDVIERLEVFRKLATKKLAVLKKIQELKKSI